MVERVSEIVNSAVSVMREIAAAWHYISDIMALLEILKLISAHGAIEGLVLWVVSSVVSASIAELLESILPTPLRILLRRLGVL